MPLAISCLRNNQSDFFLTGNNIKYWYSYYKDTLRPYGGGYCFNKNGTYLKYCNPDSPVSARKLRAFCHYPADPKPIWKITDGKTFMFGENIFYKIITLNSDSIILQNIAYPDNFVKLHKDSDQITAPKVMKWDYSNTIYM